MANSSCWSADGAPRSSWQSGALVSYCTARLASRPIRAAFGATARDIFVKWEREMRLYELSEDSTDLREVAAQSVDTADAFVVDTVRNQLVVQTWNPMRDDHSIAVWQPRTGDSHPATRHLLQAPITSASSANSCQQTSPSCSTSTKCRHEGAGASSSAASTACCTSLAPSSCTALTRCHRASAVSTCRSACLRCRLFRSTRSTPGRISCSRRAIVTCSCVLERQRPLVHAL